jgi:hypothetical protein
MAYELVWFALATLLAPVFAEYAKIRAKADKAFSFIATSGIFFLLAMGFELSFFSTVAGPAAMYGVYLFQFLGWLVLLIGVLWAASKLLAK